MVKCNRWTAPPPALLDSLVITYPPPQPDPVFTPHTDAPDTPFPLLALPCELRDRVYVHYFLALRNTHFSYRPTSHALTRWTPHPPEPPSYLPLLLSNRQVHREAEETLFRTCTLTLTHTPSGRKPSHNRTGNTLHHTLRLFPSTQAQLVQRVEKEYAYSPVYRGGRVGIDELFAMWEYMVQEAWVAKRWFPRLRVFTAKSWAFSRAVEGRCLDESVSEDRESSVEDEAQVWLQWMKAWLKGKGVVPPRWLSIEMSACYSMNAECVRRQQDALALAQRWYDKEIDVTQDEVDGSGQRWLEIWSMQRKRRRKKWQDMSVEM